jgi:hypothetical protein
MDMSVSRAGATTSTAAPPPPMTQAEAFAKGLNYFISSASLGDPAGSTPTGQRIKGRLRFVRRPGESFKDCLARVANEITRGLHQDLIITMGASAAAAITNTLRVQITKDMNISGSANIALWVGRAVFTATGGLLSMQPHVRGIANFIGFAGRAAPYVLAAEATVLGEAALLCLPKTGIASH